MPYLTAASHTINMSVSFNYWVQSYLKASASEWQLTSDVLRLPDMLFAEINRWCNRKQVWQDMSSRCINHLLVSKWRQRLITVHHQVVFSTDWYVFVSCQTERLSGICGATGMAAIAMATTTFKSITATNSFGQSNFSTMPFEKLQVKSRI